MGENKYIGVARGGELTFIILGPRKSGGEDPRGGGAKSYGRHKKKRLRRSAIQAWRKELEESAGGRVMCGHHVFL